MKHLSLLINGTTLETDGAKTFLSYISDIKDCAANFKNIAFFASNVHIAQISNAAKDTGSHSVHEFVQSSFGLKDCALLANHCNDTDYIIFLPTEPNHRVLLNPDRSRAIHYIISNIENSDSNVKKIFVDYREIIQSELRKEDLQKIIIEKKFIIRDSLIKTMVSQNVTILCDDTASYNSLGDIYENTILLKNNNKISHILQC